jgi:hypothetical protein
METNHRIYIKQIKQGFFFCKNKVIGNLVMVAKIRRQNHSLAVLLTGQTTYQTSIIYLAPNNRICNSITCITANIIINYLNAVSARSGAKNRKKYIAVCCS